MRASTGYSFAEFQALLPYFIKAHQMRIGSLEDRILNVNPFSFSTYEDYLFFLLYKLKTNLGYVNLGLVFGVSHATAEKIFKEGIKLIDLANKLSKSQPAREARNLDLDQEKPYGLDATARRPGGFIDERPQNDEKQRLCYSWKHRSCEQKVTIIADLEHSIIAFIGHLFDGSIHDKTMFEQEFKLHKEVLFDRKIFTDLAYTKAKQFCQQARFVLPIKKPKNSELTQDQKRYNRMVSALRIRVEHAIRGIKRYDVFSQRIRLKDLKFYNTLVGVGAGLWNFKCRLRLGMEMPFAA